MDTLVNWIRNNYTEIVWFVIGWLTYGCLDQLGRGHYVMALVDAALIYFNYVLWRKSNV